MHVNQWFGDEGIAITDFRAGSRLKSFYDFQIVFSSSGSFKKKFLPSWKRQREAISLNEDDLYDFLIFNFCRRVHVK